jgi:hypothetical protein
MLPLAFTVSPSVSILYCVLACFTSQSAPQVIPFGLDPGRTYYYSTPAAPGTAYVSTFDVTDLLSGGGQATLQVALGGGHYADNWYNGTGRTAGEASVGQPKGACTP